jgi:hypothetical protein
MGAVSSQQSGVASGINNTVARTAGLLAIAVSGVVMLQAFGVSLDHRLEQIQIGVEVRQSIAAQRVRLAAVQLPPALDTRVRQEVKNAVADSFIAGFRLVMAASAALAVLAAINSWLFIGRRKTKS